MMKKLLCDTLMYLQHMFSVPKQDRTQGLKCRQVNTTYFMSRIKAFWSCLPFILCNWWVKKLGHLHDMDFII